MIPRESGGPGARDGAVALGPLRALSAAIPEGKGEITNDLHPDSLFLRRLRRDGDAHREPQPADDVGSVLVIAAAYSGGLDLAVLALAGAGLVVMALLLWLGVRSGPLYFALAGISHLLLRRWHESAVQRER